MSPLLLMFEYILNSWVLQQGHTSEATHFPEKKFFIFSSLLAKVGCGDSNTQVHNADECCIVSVRSTKLQRLLVAPGHSE